MTYTIYFAENSNNLDADGFLKMCQSNPDDVSTDSEYYSGDIDEDIAVARLLADVFCRGWALVDDYACVITETDDDNEDFPGVETIICSFGNIRRD